MWKLLSKTGCGVLLSLFFAGCGLISLETLTVSTIPAESGEIIGRGIPLQAEFSIAPDRIKTEPLLRVTGGPEELQCDFRWEGSRVYITPVPEPEPGVPYVLTCAGRFSAADGRSFQVQKEVSFFYHSDEAPPKLLETVPADGGDWDRESPLSFRFDKKIDSESFSTSFFLTPGAEYVVEADASGTVLRVFPETSWSARAYYSWELSEACSGSSGVPLQCGYSGSFRVQADTIPPALTGWDPVRLIGSVYMPQPGFGKDDSLRLLFSEPVDMETLERAFTLEPDIRGAWTDTGSGAYVFTPSRPFTMEETLVMTLTRELADSAGNYLEEEIIRFFTADIPVQEIIEIRCTGRETVTIPAGGTHTVGPAVITFAGPGPEYTQLIEIDFSRPYGVQFQPVVSGAVSVRGFFPDTVANPVPEQAVWTQGGHTLRLLYSGFMSSPAPGDIELKYYKLTVPGGAEISSNGEGSCLRHDTEVLLEAERRP
jgi:hypothetical protein